MAFTNMVLRIGVFETVIRFFGAAVILLGFAVLGKYTIE
jgi:hypothetical protein